MLLAEQGGVLPHARRLLLHQDPQPHVPGWGVHQGPQQAESLAIEMEDNAGHERFEWTWWFEDLLGSYGAMLARYAMIFGAILTISGECFVVLFLCYITSSAGPWRMKLSAKANSLPYHSNGSLPMLTTTRMTTAHAGRSSASCGNIIFQYVLTNSVNVIFHLYVLIKVKNVVSYAHTA